MTAERICKSVGIDLGTTYSSLAYLDSQMTPRVVCDSSGHSVMPSVIFFDDHEILVGEMALSQAKLHAERAVQFIKVHMGDDWKKEFLGQVHTPASLSALVLGQLVREAEPQIGPIESAVITVPAYFTEKRRRATQQAGEIAGLNVIGTLNEPMAAALANGLHRYDAEQHAVIYDLGGGTFDVTVVRISPNQIEELATSGNRQLGGRDWDQSLIDRVCDDFKNACGKDPRELPQAMQDLQIECEQAKRRLNKMAKTAVRLHAFGHDHTYNITREEFEAFTAHLLQATRLTTEMALEDAGLKWNQIARIALAGGSTHMPCVRRMLKEASGIQPDTGVNPVVAVALGAAIYAHMLETGEGLMTIQQKDPGPAETLDFPRETEGHLLPISAAAAQRPIIKFVTAHGVGVKVQSRGVWKNAVLIPRNSPVPIKVTRRFSTAGASAGANHVSITITQGDAPDVEMTEVLGTGRIGLPANEAPGQPVDVTMEFDGQGRLHTRAVYVRTAQDVAMTVEVRDGLHEEQVQAYRKLLEHSGFARTTKAGEELELDDDIDEEDLPLLEPF